MGAPVGIALLAGIAVPAMMIGIPVWVGRKLHAQYSQAGKHKRNMAITGGVMASVRNAMKFLVDSMLHISILNRWLLPPCWQV